MRKKFVPLKIGLIDEGRFEERVNREIEKLTRQLTEFAREHKDASKGAKAELNVKITFSVDNPADGGYGIKTQTKSTMPPVPEVVTTAISGEGEDGHEVLLVRESGSDEISPRQGKFLDGQGRMVPSALST